MVYLLKLQIVLLSTFVFFIINSESTKSGPQKPYSQRELLVIDKFRPMVSKALTMDFQKSDAYLLRWIRYSNFDFKSATKALEKFHKYRADNDIDSISESEGYGTQKPGLTPNPRKYLPYSISGHTKEGFPIIVYPHGRWNFRKYVLAGKPEIPQRRFQEILEITTRKIFREAAASGKDVDKLYILSDLNGYSLREGGCVGCLPILPSLARTATAYGAFWKNVTLVNTPRIFNPALSIARSIIGDRLPLYVFDFDKATWQNEILKDIAHDQLPPSFQ